jgi:hypothetical protein
MAWLRTNVLVSTGAALFVMLGSMIPGESFITSGGRGERAPVSLDCYKGELLPIEIAPLTFILGA